MIARLEVTRGTLTEYPLAEKVRGGWQNGVTFYPDADVTKVTALTLAARPVITEEVVEPEWEYGTEATFIMSPKGEVFETRICASLQSAKEEARELNVSEKQEEPDVRLAWRVVRRRAASPAGPWEAAFGENHQPQRTGVLMPDPSLFDDGPSKGEARVERVGMAFIWPETSLAGEWFYSVRCRCGWEGPITYAPGDADYAAGYHDAQHHRPEEEPAWSRSN